MGVVVTNLRMRAVSRVAGSRFLALEVVTRGVSGMPTMAAVAVICCSTMVEAASSPTAASSRVPILKVPTRRVARSSMEAAIRFSTVVAAMLGMTASPGVVATEVLVVAVVLVVVVLVDLGHSAHAVAVGLITRNPNKRSNQCSAFDSHA